MTKQFLLLGLLLLAAAVPGTNTLHAAGRNKQVIETEWNYPEGSTSCRGYLAYDRAIQGKRPAILVVHEWWGCNAYARRRARMLAELGYIAFAVDLYGEGKVATNPEQAMQYATPFYQDTGLMMGRLQAALAELRKNEQVDTNRIAAIGYCFGGSMLLNAAKLGIDLKGVVSFHGGLKGVAAKPGLTKARILVCHGGADVFISADEIREFKSNLDSAGVQYQWIVYPGATHAFTNPEATQTGKTFQMPIRYNEAGDRRSWIAMRNFLDQLFPEPARSRQ